MAAYKKSSSIVQEHVGRNRCDHAVGYCNRLEDLLSVSRDVLAAGSFQEMLLKIADAACRVVHGQTGIVIYGAYAARKRDGDEKITEGVATNISVSHLENKPFYHTLIGKRHSICLTGKSLGDISAHWKSLCEHPPLRGLVGVPLLADDESINGAILISNREHGRFAKKDADMLTKLAGLVTPSLHRLEVVFKAREGRANTELSATMLPSEPGSREELAVCMDSLIVKSDENGRITFVNDYALRFFGYSKEEVYGEDVGLFVAKTSNQNGINQIERMNNFIAAPDDFVERISETILKNGNHVWVLWRNKETRDNHGRLVEILSVGHDVTALRCAQETLDESKKRFKSLFENSLDGVMMTIDDGKVIAANPRICQMLDMNEEEITERGRTGGIVVRDEMFKAALEEQKATGKYQGELTFRRKDGSLFPVETSMCTFKSSNGDIVSGQVVRDITERKRMEELLQRSYAELESLVEHRTRQVKLQAELLDLAHDAIIVRGKEGNILFWSEGAVATYGWAKNEVVGKRVQDVLQTIFPMEFEVIMDIAKRNGFWEGELIHTRKDGRAIVVFSRWALRKAVTGDHAEILEVNRDVTKRKEMEDALRKANLYNRRLIETSLDPLVAMGPEGRITDVNAATEKATGYLREELIGAEFSDYFTNSGKAKTGYQMVFKEGSVHDCELEIKHRNGSVTPILYNASVCRNELGEIVGVFAAARDITERKRVEEELTNKSIALEELNIALKVLIDRVRNETEELEVKVSTNIRVGILPYLEQLRRTRLDVGQSALIEIIERNLNDIASPFLKIITSSRFRLSPKEIEIISLIKEGKTTKEIANILSLGSRTIDSYRDNIRNKLGLSDRRTNLRTFLLSAKIE